MIAYQQGVEPGITARGMKSITRDIGMGLRYDTTRRLPSQLREMDYMIAAVQEDIKKSKLFKVV